MRKLLACFLLLSSSFALNAQFTPHPVKFLKDLESALASYDKMEAKAFMERFEPIWQSDKVTETHRQKIYLTTNLMVEKRVRTVPEIYNYFQCLLAFFEKELPDEEFNAWHTSIDKMLNGRTSKKLGEYLEMTSALFNEGVIYQTSSHHWLVRGGEFHFKYDDEPYLEFDGITLACRTMEKGKLDKKDSPYKDSVVFYQTKGVYHPLKARWVGNGARLDWAKAGLDPEKNFAMIGSYEMSLKGRKVTADSAVVTTEYYEEQVTGTFVDQAATIDVQKGGFPLFTSMGGDVTKKDILPGVDYYGGLMLRGSEFVGKGTGGAFSTLIFRRDGVPFITVRGEEFEIGTGLVRSPLAQVSIMINDRDSIYHPGVIVEMKDSLLEIHRGKEGLGQSPFFNTFHNLEMDVYGIAWIPGGSEIYMVKGMNTGEDYAEFRSVNYFDKNLFTKYMRQNSDNVLVKINDYCYKYDELTLKAGTVATIMGSTLQGVEREIYQMSNEGFLRYDKANGMVHVLPKLLDYIQYFSKKKDYDYLVFRSNLKMEDLLEETNAEGKVDKGAVARNKFIRKQNGIRQSVGRIHGRLDLRTHEMDLFALEPVTITPVRNMVVIPDSMTLTLTKERNFEFTGWLNAGEWEILLNGADFDYEKYLVNLNDVELARMRVPKFENERERQRMTSNIEGLHGYIEIDSVDDRSGSKARQEGHTKFPVLHSERESYVYYDHDFIYGGVYDSARFFFKLDPFDFDSLANFRRSAVDLEGELHSAGIFPVFRENLKVQTDYSFGFHSQAPSNGYDFYGPDAKYSNEIRLSNAGLMGSGEISYLTSTAGSEDWVFFPDSTRGIAQYTNVAKEGSFSVPDVIGEDALVTYVPKTKVMKAKSVQNPLKFFGEEATMDGYSKLTADGMTGRGYMYFGDGQMASKHFKYKRWVIDADTSNFDLANANKEAGSDENALDMATRNVKGHVDFQERKGEFRSNDGESRIEFPTNQYYCKMDMFTWFMDKDEIELSKDQGADVAIDAGMDLVEPNFFTTHPDQGDLKFMSPKAKFARGKKRLYCDKVPYVDVADARIIPVDEKLEIHRKAVIQPLDSATILANNVTKYHTIENAHVQIMAEKKYEANGDYVYKDREDNEYRFHFASVHPDTTFQTVGSGTIADDAGFKLSPEFDFYGGVSMAAGTPLLQFDGATRINHECNTLERNWMKFSAQIDRENVRIPVGKNLTNLDGEPIAIGLVLGNHSDSLDLYPAFLSAKLRSQDSMLVSSHGFLQYDAGTQEYKVASEEKLLSRAFPGDYVALHTKSCTMDCEGMINFGPETKGLQFEPVGRVSYNGATGETDITVSGKLDWYMDDNLKEMVVKRVVGDPVVKTDANPNNTYTASIQRFLNEKEAEKMTSKLATGMVVDLDVPKPIRVPFYLKDVKFKVRKLDGRLVFESVGDIGIATMDDKSVFRRYQGSFVIDRQRGSESMHFTLDLESNLNDYYFRYQRLVNFEGKGMKARANRIMEKEETMTIWTSDEEFVQMVGELKEEKRKKGGFSYDADNDPGTRRGFDRELSELRE